MPSGTAEPPRRDWSAVRAGLLVGIAYLAAGKLGLRLAMVHESATAVWAPAGIALGGFLLAGARVWPAVFAAAFLTNATTTGALASSLAIAGGNTLEGLVGLELLRRACGGRRAFDSAGGVFRFCVLAGVLAPAVAATVGAGALTLEGLAAWDRCGAIWLTWWLGDAVGILCVTPLIVLWAPSSAAPGSPRPRFETVAFVGGVFLLAFAVFGGGFRFGDPHHPVGILCLPFVVWTAFRYGPRATALAVAGMAGIALWGTLQGRGPFVRADAHESLLGLQVFMGFLAVTTLAVAAAVEERRRADAEIAARLRELTELNRALDLRKGELSTYHRLLSHDVSNVSGAALALLERLLLEADGPLSRKQQELLRRLYRQALEMNRMSENARMLVQIRDHGATEPRSAVDVSRTLRRTLETVRTLHFDRPFDATVEGVDGLTVQAPPFLESVFLNLIDNAVRHSPRDVRPSIRIRSTEDDDGVRIAVRGGAPPPPELVAQLFRREFPNRGSAGHGLGLVLVREVVQREGGAIRAQTVNDGEGDRFEVELSLPRR